MYITSTGFLDDILTSITTKKTALSLTCLEVANGMMLIAILWYQEGCCPIRGFVNTQGVGLAGSMVHARYTPNMSGKMIYSLQSIDTGVPGNSGARAQQHAAVDPMVLQIFTGNRFQLHDHTSWSSWFYGTCSVTCGPGTSGKLRRCSTGKEADCPGKAFEILSCDEGPCPIDGSWGSWQAWSTCSTTCGDGSLFRTRICNNPAPQNNGLNCSGSFNETSTCNHGDCPHWLPFYETSTCSTTCGAGFLQLRRNCSSGNPRDCHGSEYSEKPCNLMDCS
ncbi:thrombospondin-1-like [Mercenaria mercenaria]|uniref:thrombospondin-1-like n=1 Tax=Mercenaria mercenaria TaxID=6596 RepID=UPI00234F0BEC|nr:thrombospondin-1-like [Mercenaria mercenaria]